MAQDAARELRASLEQLRSKRPRVDAAAPEVEQLEPQPPHYEKYKDYTLVTFRREESKEMIRRAVVPKEQPESAPPKPRTGELGALEHWRRGLIGAVQSWAAGSIENAILLLVRLIDHFNVVNQIFDILNARRTGVCVQQPCCAALASLLSPSIVA